MLELVIRQPGAPDVSGKLPSGTYLAGSSGDCQIQLSGSGISPHHAQFIVHDNLVTVMDLGSRDGTFNREGEELLAHEPFDIAPGDGVKMGRITLIFRVIEQGVKAPAPRTALPPETAPAKKPESVPPKPVSSHESYKSLTRDQVPILQITGVSPQVRPLLQQIKKMAHAELLKRLNLKKLAISGVSQEELKEKAVVMVKEILSDLTAKLPPSVPAGVLEKELLQEAIGLGPLEYLIARDDISEIMVNGPEQIYVEQKGTLYLTDTAFADDNQVLSAIERIVSPLGRRIDESSPMVDARLADGSRVNAIIPPLSLSGPTVTIRKFSKKPLQADDLIRFGSVSPEIVSFLAVCVAVRKNIIISGGTGSGKTTLLNVLSTFLPNRERIVTIEDAAELQLQQQHVVRLEARPPNVEGKGGVAIRDLVRNALRMRPDRIVVGECRGGETLDMLQAMNTGHDGSLTTIHANTPRDALSRLETLVLMSGFDLPLRAIREQVASAINIIVQITRERDGSRKIINVSEITKMEGDIISMQDIFVFRQTGWDENNRITGVFEPTGAIPSFMEEIERAKLPLDISIFQPPKQQQGGGSKI